jgi:hypothetical protein
MRTYWVAICITWIVQNMQVLCIYSVVSVMWLVIRVNGSVSDYSTWTQFYWNGLVLVQILFHRAFKLSPPSRPSVCAHRCCLYKDKRVQGARPACKVDTVRSMQKSTRRVNREVSIPQPTACKIIGKRLQMECTKFQIFQQLKPADGVKLATFCAEMTGKVLISRPSLFSLLKPRFVY